MQNQLQEKLRKRQIASGLIPDEPPPKTQQKYEPPKSNPEFQARRKQLEAFFQQGPGGSNSATQNTVVIPK